MSKLFLSFFLYGFLGFLLEVAFARITRAKKQDRKCLILLPLCPVYGLGALAVTHLPATVQQRPLLLFLFGALVATAAEYAVDWFCDTALKVRFWDYSDRPWSLNGRVCLQFSFFWGLLAVILVTWVHPWMGRLTAAVPAGWTLPIFLVFLSDCILSALSLRATGTTDSLRWYDHIHARRKRTDG